MKSRQKSQKSGRFYLIASLLLLIIGSIIKGNLSVAKTKSQNSSITTTAQLPLRIDQKGSKILVHGKSFPVAWFQGEQNSSMHIGISDLGAMQALGIELLNTRNPDLQPIRWFSGTVAGDFQVKTKLSPPYRYLDLTEFAKQQGWTLEIQGDTLKINAPLAKLEKIRLGNKSWGKRIVLDLNRPTFWQLSQTPKEGVVIVHGTPNLELLDRFAPPREEEEEAISEEEEGENQGNDEPIIPEEKLEFPDSIVPIVEQEGEQTKIHLNYPQGYGLRVFSLPNPNRLVIDVRADPLLERDILWTKGLRWRQQFVEIETVCDADSTEEESPQESKTIPCIEQFPVVSLEVDVNAASLSLQPIWTSSETMTGTSSLLAMTRRGNAVASINGGFFNRNNQLPLGAIRRNNQWFSSPILNRGAIAWTDEGKTKIGRLSLQETLTLDQGQTLPILFLNSGYVQRGIARYTSEWGKTYTPLTDNETLFIVRNHQVMEQIAGGIAGENSIPIPPDGYLLTSRANTIAADQIPVGTRVNLNSQTSPPEFSSYPHIVAAGPVLLSDRQIILDGEQEKFSKAFNQQKASRSAIGSTNRGTLILAAVHHRPQGKGPTLAELAQVMQNLGAIDALNLDGGSSTSLYLGGQLIDRSPVTAARIHNGIGIFLQTSPF